MSATDRSGEPDAPIGIDDVPEPRAAAGGWVHRLLPRPWTALWLLLAWLLLNQTLAPGHLLLGALLAVVLSRLPRAVAAGAPAGAPRDALRRRAAIAGRLSVTVLQDIVVANLQGAARILGPQARLTPRFVWVPLEVQRPASITLLAGIITMTPGTLSVELSDDHRWLLVHGLDVGDAERLVADIKARYETPIKELLE
jgi:multicomponent K+:H+ antiporter subunit E